MNVWILLFGLAAAGLGYAHRRGYLHARWPILVCLSFGLVLALLKMCASSDMRPRLQTFHKAEEIAGVRVGEVLAQKYPGGRVRIVIPPRVKGGILSDLDYKDPLVASLERTLKARGLFVETLPLPLPQRVTTEVAHAIERGGHAAGEHVDALVLDIALWFTAEDLDHLLREWADLAEVVVWAMDWTISAQGRTRSLETPALVALRTTEEQARLPLETGLLQMALIYRSDAEAWRTGQIPRNTTAAFDQRFILAEGDDDAKEY